MPKHARGSGAPLDALPAMPTALADHVALYCGGVRLTYSELNTRAERLARALVFWDLGRGVRVAILADRCHRVVETHMAALRAGAVLVPLDPDWSPRDAADLLIETRSRALFVSVEFLPQLEAIGRAAREVDALPVILTDRPPQGLFSYERLLASCS